MPRTSSWRLSCPPTSTPSCIVCPIAVLSSPQARKPPKPYVCPSVSPKCPQWGSMCPYPASLLTDSKCFSTVCPLPPVHIPSPCQRKQKHTARCLSFVGWSRRTGRNAETAKSRVSDIGNRTNIPIACVHEANVARWEYADLVSKRTLRC